VVEAPEDRAGSDDTIRGEQPRLGQRGFLVQTLMGSDVVIVGEVLLKHPPEMPLAQNDQMPHTLLPQGADEPFYVAVALGLADLDRANAAIGGASPEGLPVERITIPNEKPRPLIKGHGLHHLLGYPDVRGLIGDVEVDDATPGMSQDDKHIQRLEADGLHPEPVAGPDVAPVGSQKGHPAHGRRPRTAPHVLGDASGRDLDAELAQLSGDAILSPEWVLGGHASDESLHVIWQRRAAWEPALPSLPPAA